MNPAPTSTPIDQEKLSELQELFCDEGELNELFQEFWDEVPERLGSIRNGVACNELEIVTQAAHALKGSSANLGADGVRHVAGELEEQARAGSLEQGADLVQQLDQELERLEGWLRQEQLID